LLNLSEFVNNGSTNNSACLLRSMENFVQSYDIFCHSLHVRHKPAGFTINFARTNTIEQPFVNRTYLFSGTQSVKFPILHASNTVLILKFFTNFLKFCKGLQLLVFDPRNYAVRLEATFFCFSFVAMLT
jgi:hypothetical protein